MNDQETSADIIAEMRGARTEFPFAYLIGEADTPEVIGPRTKEITEPRKINIRRVTVKELADRFEAALKRETGNYPKLREALEELVSNIEMRASAFGIFSIIDRKTFFDAKAALAATEGGNDGNE